MSIFKSKTKVKDVRTPETKAAAKWTLDELRQPTPEFPTQGVASMSPSEQLAQDMVFGYAQSKPEGMDVLRGFTNAQTPGITPEIQSLIDEVMERGSRETERVGRKIQMAGAGRSGTGMDMLGQSIQDTQRNVLNVALPYITAARENAENRKMTAAELLNTLGESSMINRINALSATGSLPRILEQLKKDAEYAKAMNQIQFPYTQQANLAGMLLQSPNQLSVVKEPSTFSQIAPLIGIAGKLF